MTRCPTEEDLVRFVDGSLAVEAADGLKAHVAHCQRCREHDQELRTLIEDVKAAVPTKVDVRVHVRAVMDVVELLDSEIPKSSKPRAAWLMASAGSVAACALVLALYLGRHALRAPGPWQARGGDVQATIGRDVGVQPYAVQGGLRPLASGVVIDGTTPLTAGFRNLGATPAFLLLFAVDSRHVVHWISPQYSRPEDNAVSTPLPTTVNEQVLPMVVVLDDVAHGPLRIIAVVTSAPAHVSDVESFEGLEFSARLIAARLAGADVRETVVQVREIEGGLR
jgi:anti-sigma factor RsiW